MSPTIANTFDMDTALGFVQGRSLGRNRPMRKGGHVILAWVDHARSFVRRQWRARWKTRKITSQVHEVSRIHGWIDVTGSDTTTSGVPIPFVTIHQDAEYGNSSTRIADQMLFNNAITQAKQVGQSVVVIVMQGINKVQYVADPTVKKYHGPEVAFDEAGFSVRVLMDNLSGTDIVGGIVSPILHEERSVATRTFDWLSFHLSAAGGTSISSYGDPVDVHATIRTPLGGPKFHNRFSDVGVFGGSDRARTRVANVKDGTVLSITNIVFPSAGPNDDFFFGSTQQTVVERQKRTWGVDDVTLRVSSDHRWYRELAQVVNEVTAP